jgi:uncharacterized membrane protein
MNKSGITILFIFFGLLFSAPAFSGSAHPITAPIEGAAQSVYTDRVIELIRDWKNLSLPSLSESDRSFWIEGIRTEGNSNYIGLRKRVFIHAAPSAILSVLEDFGSYPKIFPGVEQVKVVSQDANRFTTHWVRERPLFLAPKVEYEQTYVTQVDGDRTFLRYQLHSGNSMSHSDGVIVVEPAPGGAYVSSYDFFEGNFGIAKFVAESKIWERTFEGFQKADLALKFKAENPDWSLSQIESKVDAELNANPPKLSRVRFLASVPQ